MGGYLPAHGRRPLSSPVVCSRCDRPLIVPEGEWVGPCGCGLVWSLVVDVHHQDGTKTVRWLKQQATGVGRGT
jgi:hypothetical protein